MSVEAHERLLDNIVWPSTSHAIESNYTTYFGGPSSEDATKIAFDEEGNTILIGQTQSTVFPVTVGAVQQEYGGGEWDAFVAKFATDGDLVFCSYLGGSEYEHVTSVCFDGENNIILAGVTWSPDFRTTQGAYLETYRGGGDGFVVKMTANGTGLIYGSFFGGAGEDWIYGLHSDGNDRLLFSGWTTSSGLATAGTVQPLKNALGDAFVARLNCHESTLEMFSYFGGSGMDRSWCMAVDSDMNYVISGMTQSDDLCVNSSALQTEYAGDTDAFIARISQAGDRMMFCSYIGGAGEDLGLGVDVDSYDNLILSGPTESRNLPVCNALNPQYLGGLYDSFFVKFDTAGSTLYCSYLGGNASDLVWDAQVDKDGHLCIAARTSSDDYPIRDASQAVRAGSYDACVTVISADGQSILASTYIGGNLTDIAEGIALDDQGNIVVSGSTASRNFPVTGNAWQGELAGSFDLFVCHKPLLAADSGNTTTSGMTTELVSPETLLAITAVVVVAFIAAAMIVTRSRR